MREVWGSFLAMGDSTVEGWGDQVGDVPLRGWPDWVADGLASARPGLIYRNVGRKGATSADVLRDQVPAIAERRPGLVSLAVGGNDARREDWSRAGLEERLGRIMAAASDAGADILVLAYPDIRPAIEAVGHVVSDSWRPYFERMHEVNDAIRAAAAASGACLLDMEAYAPARDARYLSHDFTHPNSLGYRMTGELALGALSGCFDLPQLRAEEDAAPAE